MLTPHHLKSFLSSFVYTPAYTCSHTLTSEHDPHHYDVDNIAGKRLFFKIGPPHFCMVFSTIGGTLKKTK